MRQQNRKSRRSCETRIPAAFVLPGNPSMEDLKIAVVCMHALPGRPDKNLERTETFVREAAKKSADIICFPEFALSGYFTDSPERVYSRAVSDDLIRSVTEMASRHRLVIVTGMIEMTGRERPFISQIVAGPRGILGIHRKTHLSPPEQEKYQPGRTLDILPCGKAALGVQLCYEAHFPEISTVMTLKGAEVICIPHASPHGTPEEKFRSWLRHLPGRAFDNSLFVVACNQVGAVPGSFAFPGVALVINPLGRVIRSYRGGEEKMIVAKLKAEELREVRGHRMKSFLPNRRPELYGDLVRDPGKDEVKPCLAPLL